MSARTLSFEEWYRGAHPGVLARVRLRTRSVEDAKESVDEAFVRAYERWWRVRRMACPEAWVYTVAINHDRRRHRRSGRERELLEVAPRPRPAPDPGDTATLELARLFAGLSPRQREVAELFYLADLSQDQIAAALRISRSSVASSLAQARDHLRPLLAADRAAAGGKETTS